MLVKLQDCPPLVDLDSFAIQIKESDILSIPSVLEYHKDECDARGKLAKQAYNKYFSSDVYLETIIDMYLEEPRLFSRSTLIRRAFVRSDIREFRSLVNLGNRIRGLRSFVNRLAVRNIEAIQILDAATTNTRQRKTRISSPPVGVVTAVRVRPKASAKTRQAGRWPPALRCAPT
jgi:hypothetical protein